MLVPVPEETARVARTAYPKGNLYLQIRDELGTIYEDKDFAHLFPNCGHPAEAPWRLLLVCLMQFARSDSLISKQQMRFADGLIGSIS
jgi:transposase